MFNSTLNIGTTNNLDTKWEIAYSRQHQTSQYKMKEIVLDFSKKLTLPQDMTCVSQTKKKQKELTNSPFLFILQIVDKEISLIIL